ncbi:MAG: ubiquinone biosynthesis protein [Lachnospiraceae bacterium]|nr:ubiquinone biosynthesis protein [Lachnospiraceae bacterium]
MRKLRKYLSLVTLGIAICLSMTGCGNNTTTGSTSGNNDNNVIEDVVDDTSNAVKDVADGVGNAVDDLVGNGGFDNYKDAHDYFMDTMSSYHADANFEIRDEDQNLNDYQEGSKGYRFNLYDTSNDKNGSLFGEFYVDANSGMIYRKDENGKINEYPGSDNGTTTGSSNKNNKQNSNSGSTSGNRGTGSGTTSGSRSNSNTNGTITGSNR